MPNFIIVLFQSRESSVSSSPKSGSVNLSNASTPAGTPGKFIIENNYTPTNKVWGYIGIIPSVCPTYPPESFN